MVFNKMIYHRLDLFDRILNLHEYMWISEIYFSTKLFFISILRIPSQINNQIFIQYGISFKSIKRMFPFSQNDALISNHLEKKKKILASEKASQ